MKRTITLFAACLLAHLAVAQYVIVNSPASIAGGKSFSAGTMSVDLTTGIWTADAVLIQDAAGASLGCNAATNAAEIAGKIALVDRGTCNFSVKVFNAKKAGALAIVVMNNTAGAGTIAMGTTAVAGDTFPAIPAVMITYEDGLAIKAELANGPVNMTIGNIVIDFNLHTDRKLVLNGPVGAIPTSQIDGFAFAPGLALRNDGALDAVGIDVVGAATFTPATGGAATPFWGATEKISELLVDSLVLVTMADFAPTSTPGKYDFTYNITSANPDGAPFDNTIKTEFSVTDNVYGKGRWDWTNKRAIQTNAYRPANAGSFEFITGFHFPHGKGYQLDSLKFYISTNSVFDLKTKVAPGTLNAYVYKWTDDDASGGLTAGELAAVSVEEVAVNTAAGVKNGYLTVPIIDLGATTPNGVQLKDDDYYYVGIRCDVDSCFIGFDESYDYTALIELTPTLTPDHQHGYFGTQVWDGLEPSVDDLFYFTNLRAALAIGVYTNEATGVIGTNNLLGDKAKIHLSPNPASEQLVAETLLTEAAATIEYSIFSSAGRLVGRSFSDAGSTYDKALFNVSNFAAGQYFLQVKTAQGSKTVPFTVQH